MDLTPILKMVFDLVKVLVPSKTGTKFLLTLGGMAGILYMVMKDKATVEYVQYFVYILIAYYIADILSNLLRRKKDEKETTVVSDSDSDSV